MQKEKVNQKMFDSQMVVSLMVIYLCRIHKNSPTKQNERYDLICKSTISIVVLWLINQTPQRNVSPKK